MASGTKRVTILDVAAQAGVHPGTVSRALTRPDKVADATRARIEQVVAELGFVPNRAARGLITGRTGNVAVIVPDLTNPFFALLVRSITSAAGAQDLQVLLVDTGERPERESEAARSLGSEVDGLIVVSPRGLHRDVPTAASTPTVFVNRRVAGRASVVMRSAAAAEVALRRLAELGHRRVVHVGGPSGAWAATERREVIERTGRSLGFDVHTVQAEAPTVEHAAAAVDLVVEQAATAVMAFNDQLALGVISGLARRGIRVPDDVSVVGCDDVPMAELVAPSLTTITMPADAAGVAAVDLLDGPPRDVELAGTFVERASIGQASASPGA